MYVNVCVCVCVYDERDTERERGGERERSNNRRSIGLTTTTKASSYFHCSGGKFHSESQAGSSGQLPPRKLRLLSLLLLLLPRAAYGAWGREGSVCHSLRCPFRSSCLLLYPYPLPNPANFFRILCLCSPKHLLEATGLSPPRVWAQEI